MNKKMLALVIIAPIFLVTGCVTESVYYTPAYRTPYVTTVGYNGTPYWNNAYYYGYEDIGNVGYWGMYDSYNAY